MKKFLKVLLVLGLWLVALPCAAGAMIMSLWNWLIPPVCGFAAISFGQAVGLFLLGQLATLGFVAGLFLLWGMLHLAGLHPHHGPQAHWHSLTDEQRREFFERRRRWHDMMYKGLHSNQAADGNEQ